jgi:hypothetical protein
MLYKCKNVMEMNLLGWVRRTALIPYDFVEEENQDIANQHQV